ncbi:hypothetical protein PVAG01_03619 [Phlyctema vagabunda]|uniref:Uncharacterized protein n=1 Tax=Phlyctema vagabunda TaxID=108571 RepID=A0ABR4PLW8_9HELO
MARQAEARRASPRIRARDAPRESTLKSPGATRHVGFATPIMGQRKIRKVSASALFRKEPAKKKAVVTPREKTPEDETWLLEIQEGLVHAHDHIESYTKQSLDQIRQTYEAKLNETHLSTAPLLDFVAKNYSELNLPLAQEKVQTTFKNQSGDKVPKIEEIGVRVNAFKKLVDREINKLNEYWKQWDEVQRQFHELGGSILVEKELTAGLSTEPKPVDASFNHAMELIDTEHETNVQETLEDIKALGLNMVDKLKKSEMVRFSVVFRN